MNFPVDTSIVRNKRKGPLTERAHTAALSRARRVCSTRDRYLRRSGNVLFLNFSQLQLPRGFECPRQFHGVLTIRHGKLTSLLPPRSSPRDTRHLISRIKGHADADRSTSRLFLFPLFRTVSPLLALLSVLCMFTCTLRDNERSFALIIVA